jgi:hypothetical protein
MGENRERAKVLIKKNEIVIDEQYNLLDLLHKEC